MKSPDELRAQAERCRLVGARYGDEHRAHMEMLADQLEAQAQMLERAGLPIPPGATGVAT